MSGGSNTRTKVKRKKGNKDIFTFSHLAPEIETVKSLTLLTIIPICTIIGQEGTMVYNELNDILSAIRKQKGHLEKKYKIKDIGVFGSYVRGDQTSESDLDVLVNYSDNSIDIFDFLDLKEYLSTLMPMEVDLVMKDSLKPGIGKNILKEVVYA